MSTTGASKPILKRIEELSKKIDKVDDMRQERVRLMREALGSHSQNEVARAAGMTRQGVQNVTREREAK